MIRQNPYITHQSPGGGVVWIPSTMGPTTTPTHASDASLAKKYWKYTATEDIKVDGLSLYHDTTAGTILIGLYADNADSPGARLGYRELNGLTAGLQWKQYNFPVPIDIASGTIFWASRRVSDNITEYFDWITNPLAKYKGGNGTYEYAMPNPADSTYPDFVLNKQYGIYINTQVKQ